MFIYIYNRYSIDRYIPGSPVIIYYPGSPIHEILWKDCPMFVLLIPV